MKYVTVVPTIHADSSGFGTQRREGRRQVKGYGGAACPTEHLLPRATPETKLILPTYDRRICNNIYSNLRQ